MLYPGGAVATAATVVDVRATDAGIAVITDRTVFHPLDHTWPDQPADRGTLDGQAVRDCVTGAVGPDGQLLIGPAIPARRGDDGWDWVVCHMVDAAPAVGDVVDLRVDADYRGALSAAHTACHLAALALNAVTAELWRKDAPRRDSLGSPDLDGLAIERSTITAWRSRDEYRLGKSIRKKGLDTESLLTGLPDLAAAATAKLQGWIATGGAVSIETGGDETLPARRTWRCELPEGDGEYPCGGTHVASLSDLPSGTRVEYRPKADGFAADTIVE